MKALISILESLEINNAISLDDSYNAANKVSEYESVGIEEFSSAYSEVFGPSDIDLIYDAGIATIGDFFKNEDIPEKMKKHVQAAIEGLWQPERALSFLESGFQESAIKYHKICDVGNIEDVPTTSAIWFVDKKIGNRNILSEVVPIIMEKQRLHNNPFIVVVFTTDDSLCDLNSSWQKRFDYLTEDLKLEEEQAKELAYSFFVISKKEVEKKLEHNETAACQYVEKILIDAFVGYCAFNVVSRVGNYAEKAYRQLFDIAKDSSQSTLETIHYNMVAEGEPNIYHSFKAIHNLMQEKLYTANFTELEKYILAMKRTVLLSNHSMKSRQQTIEDIVLQHDWAQYQFIHRDTNISFLDIAYGDIFDLVYDGTPYIGILITQPCDCVLRTDDGTGKAIKRKAQTFTLLLYMKRTLCKDDLRNEVKDIQNYGIILEYEIIDRVKKDWKISYINVKDSDIAVQLPAFILDLISINADGKAKLLYGQALKDIISKKKTQNWSKYEPSFQTKILAFKSQIELLQEKIPDEAENILSSIYGIPFSIEKQEFAVERLGHLEPNLIELASYHYISHTYRTGKNSLIALHNGEGEQ